MNYATLKADVAAFLNRTDLDSAIPTFVRLTESRMNRTIRTRQMEYRVVASIDKQFSTLPTDFLEMRNIQLNTSPVTALEYVTPQQADQIRASELSGRPQFFSVVANRLELIPPPQESYMAEMVYYAQIPAINDISTSNWLIVKHYDLYLYGTLVQAALYLKDDATSWATLFDSALSELKVEDQRSQFHGTTPQVRGIRIG